MTPELRERWTRIAAHPFHSDAVALDFLARLARDHGWSRDYARGAIEEYRRFCFLATLGAGAVTPSPVVDEVWHLHLTCTRDYWSVWCAQALAAPLHHEPTAGGHADGRRFRAQYADTLALYQQHFGPPPDAYWPATAERFRAPQRFRWVDRERVWLLPRPPRPGRMLLLGLVAIAAALLLPAAVWALPLNPLDWNGPQFLTLYVGLLAACAGLVPLLRGMSRWLSDQPQGARWTDTLGPADIAYLDGGAERVLDTAVAGLMSSDALRVDRDGKLEAVPGPAPADGVAAAVHAAVSDGTRWSGLRKAVAPAIQGVEHRLLHLGLLFDGATRQRIARRSALAPMLVLLLGLAKVSVGLSRGRPVGFLVALNGVGAVLLLLAWYLPTAQRTPTATRVLGTLRKRHHHATLAPRSEDLGLAVALGGTAVLLGTAYADFHQFRRPAGSGGGSSDGGSSDSGDGGSEGGSGCGSGCGGCGGGGGD